MPATAYLSLGSNVGDREAHLLEAQSRLNTLGRVTAVSSTYETEPVEFTEQPWFLNCAVALETEKTPQELMDGSSPYRRTNGPSTRAKKGPRSIDIDILLFGGAIAESNDLTIPHPAMQHRRFVLEPLAEVAPGATHPVFHKTIRELLAALPEGQAVRKF